MHSYAQTNIELFNQLRRDGYSKADLDLVRDAYGFAMVLFTGRFQPSGKSFIAHGVGTASILASAGASPQVIAAGLLHNVYQNGDFGNGQRGTSTVRRRAIRRVLGPEVEENLAKFPTLYWGSPLVRMAREDPEKLPPADRAALMMIIADQLEHLQDLAFLYYGGAIAQGYIDDSKVAAVTAANLGLVQLATELRRAIQAAEFADTPVTLPEPRVKNASFVIVPASCRKRYFIMLKQSLIQGAQASHQMLRRVLRVVRRRETLKTESTSSSRKQLPRLLR